MNDGNDTAPTVAAPVVPAVPVVPPVDPAAAAAAGTPAAPVAGEPEKKDTGWFQKRIDSVTKEKWEERRARETAEAKLADAERQLSALRTPGQPGTPAAAPVQGAGAQGAPVAPLAAPAGHPGGIPPGYVPASDVERRAREFQAQREFDGRCNTIYEQGKKDIPGFEESVSNFRAIGGLGAHVPMLQAITQLENGAAILHHLGQNLEQADRLAQMNPMSMAMELSKLSNTIKAPPTVSNAPAPVQPVNAAGGGAGDVPAPDADGNFKSQGDYRKWRQKQFARR